MDPTSWRFLAGSQPPSQPDLSQQATIPQPAVQAKTRAPRSKNTPSDPVKKRGLQKFIFPAVLLAFMVLIYFVWNPPIPAPVSTGAAITQQNFSSTSTSTFTNTNSTSSSSSTGSGTIQVYITGAVKNPGVYTLPANARVMQLLQAAGGPLPKANLVALNLAAKLTDGEEIYVTVVGEIPPTYMGGVPGTGSSASGNTTGLVNINTATATELEQQLHVSSTTANNIVNYRNQNGPYTSVEQLLQVVSVSIYNRIKNMVTV